MLNRLFEDFDNIIVVDVETTGIDVKSDEIIELTFIRLINNQDSANILDEADLLVKLSEGRQLPALITKLTGIDEQQLTNEGVSKQHLCTVLSEVLSCSRPLVAAYNAQFDLCFLYYFLERFGKADILKNIKMLDVLTIYKDRKPYPHKLSDAVAAYSLHTQNTHRAIDDTKATLELLGELEKELDDLHQYVNLFGFNPKYGISGPKISSVKYLPQIYDNIGKLYDV